MTLILNRDDVISVLTMADAIEAVEAAFAELARGTAVLPLRNAITPPDGLALYMPAYLKEMGALACKVVTVYKNNPRDFDMPTTIGKVLLQDPRTGDVICIMDGGYLTAVRTGAVSGVATRYLAKNEKAMCVGVFGAGVQAKMQLWAMCEVRDIIKAYVHDISEEAADAFVREMGEKLSIEVVRASSGQEILEQCSIICTATSSAIPLFNGELLREGTHINGIGSHTPGARELDTATIQRSLFVGDSREACLKEAGDIIIPIAEGSVNDDHIFAELGEVIVGQKAGRVASSQITLFKSNGLAIQDAATAKIIYNMAVKKGIGTQIRI
ncbi:ornithine cyclodeaminase family protein [Myxococcota bacterium]|nr:ornithine cyclodeaminase family protein [Myxococcota bacterium]MBU1534056.1 ornithine cyclodeaminase family protein [Myxococcota bacterium]